MMLNSKSQIPNKSQIKSPMTETILFGILDFGHWSLFVVWCLEFGA
jgi:hypothetical protein